MIFPKGKSALLKKNFGTSRKLRFCQSCYDDFSSITGILERIDAPPTLSSIYNLDLDP